MIIAIATDHAGFPLKPTLVEYARSLGHDVLDLGTNNTQPVDYPEVAEKLGRAILGGQAERGILLCGSGVGACIAANKLKGIYASVCHDTFSAHQGVEHDDMNVVCIGAQIVGIELAKDIVAAFLGARYWGKDPGQERHDRRVAMIRKLEDR
jgi:ribose 5-phosphate isomerase B